MGKHFQFEDNSGKVAAIITALIILGAFLNALVKVEVINFPFAVVLPWVFWVTAAIYLYKVLIWDNGLSICLFLYSLLPSGGNYVQEDDETLDDESEYDQELDAVFENGVLTINEGVEVIDSGSIKGYKGLKKVVFPASLEEIYTCAITKQYDIEELDFSKVTKLKVLPEYMVMFMNMPLTRFVIPQGVEVVEKSFLCACDLNELYIPSSVRFMRYPLDFGEEMEENAKIYIYAENLDIERLGHNAVSLDIYVLEEYYDNYLAQFYNLEWDKIADERIRLHKMPQDKRNFYALI